MPTISSLVAAMFADELRLYSQVPIEISMEISDGPTTSTVGEADNAIYFTSSLPRPIVGEAVSTL